MKLAEHVESIRQLIDTSFRNRLGRMGITASGLQPVEAIPEEYREDRRRIEGIQEVFIAETGSMRCLRKIGRRIHLHSFQPVGGPEGNGSPYASP